MNPEVPRDLETVCLKCLRKKPTDRYTGAADLADDLRRFLSHEPVKARPVGRTERAVKWAKRRPAVALLLAMVVLVTLTGVGAFAWAYRKASRETAHAKELLAEAQYTNSEIVRAWTSRRNAASGALEDRERYLQAREASLRSDNRQMEKQRLELTQGLGQGGPASWTPGSSTVVVPMDSLPRGRPDLEDVEAMLNRANQAYRFTGVFNSGPFNARDRFLPPPLDRAYEMGRVRHLGPPPDVSFGALVQMWPRLRPVGVYPDPANPERYVIAKSVAQEPPPDPAAGAGWPDDPLPALSPDQEDAAGRIYDEMRHCFEADLRRLARLLAAAPADERVEVTALRVDNGVRKALIKAIPPPAGSKGH
jgi:hypothetical protein